MPKYCMYTVCIYTIMFTSQGTTASLLRSIGCLITCRLSEKVKYKLYMKLFIHHSIVSRIVLLFRIGWCIFTRKLESKGELSIPRFFSIVLENWDVNFVFIWFLMWYEESDSESAIVSCRSLTLKLAQSLSPSAHTCLNLRSYFRSGMTLTETVSLSSFETNLSIKCKNLANVILIYAWFCH